MANPEMSGNLAHSLDEGARTRDVLTNEEITFDSLLLPNHIFEGLKQNGFRKPSPIQLKAIPVGRCGFENKRHVTQDGVNMWAAILQATNGGRFKMFCFSNFILTLICERQIKNGKSRLTTFTLQKVQRCQLTEFLRVSDIIVKSKSGTGKTIVFTVVALETIDTTKNSDTMPHSRDCGSSARSGLKVESFIGGTPLNEDKEKCNNCHVVVGTPGRVKHLINENILKSEYLGLFVLDEADKLMEESFLSDINEIYNALPAKKQIITTSATYPNSLEKYLSEYMVSPTFITTELETPLLLGLKQFVSVIDKFGDIGGQVILKTEELIRILSSVTYTQCMVFFNYKGRSESVTNLLNKSGFQAICIHAGQSQPERLAAMEKFKSFKCRVLTSTDLTARGIDAANVDLVINYDIPTDAMTYGSTGACINITIKHELTALQKILGCIGGSEITIPQLPEFAGTIQDLLKMEIAPENCINGIVSDTPFKDIRSRINELKKGKQAGNPKQKTATKTKKKAKKEAKTSDDAAETLNAAPETESNAILASLASGTFQFDTEAEPNDSPQSSSEPEEVQEKRDNSGLLASLASGTFQFDTAAQPTQTDGRTEEDTTVSAKNSRSPTSSSGSNKKCLKKPKREDIYCKNKALLDVTKILINADSVRAEDTSLQACLDTLKLNEKDKVSKYSKKVVSELLDALKSDGSTLDEESKESESSERVDPIENQASTSSKKIGDVDIERIFEVAYNSIVRSVIDDNLEAYLEKLKTKTGNGDNLNGSVSMVVNDGLSEESEECEGPVEIMKWVPVKKDEDVDNVDGDVGEEDRYDRTNDVELSRWMPADDGSAADPQQHRRQYAVQTAHTDVELFDEWFYYEWEAQLYTVRNYVQQNIYMDQMNKSRNFNG
nr:unnamed protein product [Callosobruchus chinensis]